MVLVGDANLVYHLGKHHNNAIWLSSLSALAFFHVSSTHRSCFIIRLCVNIPFRVGIRPYVHTCCYVNFPVATRVEYDTLKIGISFVTRLFNTPGIRNIETGANFCKKEKIRFMHCYFLCIWFFWFFYFCVFYPNSEFLAFKTWIECF